MEVQEQQDGGNVRLRLAGEFTLNTAPEVRQRLRSSLKARPAAVIVNMASVSYIDSAGMATLIDFLRQVIQLVMTYSAEMLMAYPPPDKLYRQRRESLNCHWNRVIAELQDAG